MDQDRLIEFTKRAQLSAESLSPTRVEELRIEMERASAQRLLPHYIRAFFHVQPLSSPSDASTWFADGVLISSFAFRNWRQRCRCDDQGSIID